jgi:glucose-6-phosphate 1-epimerase
MATTAVAENSWKFPGASFSPKATAISTRLEINTAWSTAEVYLHGAHITHFQKKDQPPVLFLSQLSRFTEGTGHSRGHPGHLSLVRIARRRIGPRVCPHQTWDLREVSQSATGEVVLRLSLPDSPSAALFPKFTADYWITVGKTLTAQLVIANVSSGQDFTFEDCLHSYFHVGDIAAVSITGLKGVDYLDKTENFARKTERAEHIKISQETDRIYLNTAGPVEIHDSNLGRRIRIEKSGSLSTVVWNPWVDKAEQMPDFGGEEFQTDGLCRIRQRGGKPPDPARGQKQHAQSGNRHIAVVENPRTASLLLRLRCVNY